MSALFYCIFNFHFKDEIIYTPLHPFYVVGVGFKHAKDLVYTDMLLTAQGKCAKIQSIEVESLDALETTYNLEVEDFHTYYVSDNNILVHNRCVAAIKNDKSIARDIVGEGRYGAYDITYSSGEHYIGKGGQARMWKSASIHETGSLKVTAVKWRSANSNRVAFMLEAKWMKNMQLYNVTLINKIASPGFKMAGWTWKK